MRRFVSLSMALLALVISVPGLATAQEATPEAQTTPTGITSTEVRYVVPFSPDGLNPNLSVRTTETGVCSDPSAIALDRPDAWDCMAGSGQFYDPCFENPFVGLDEPGDLACFVDPFTTEVVLLTLTTPLDRQKEARSPSDPGLAGAGDPASTIDQWDLPWALELANGEQCTLFHGTLTVIAGQVAHYSCDGGGVAFGEVNHSRPVWTVSYLSQGEWVSTQVEIRTVWT